MRDRSELSQTQLDMTDRMSMSELHKRFGTADDFTPSSDPIDNQRGLQRWVFTFVTRAGDEPD